MSASAATGGSTHRGRPREFDEDVVLDAVMHLFNEHGFEASSLAEIVEAAGLNKSSLYNAFGSKDELFRRVLERYVDRREAMLAFATSGDGGLDDLLGVLEFVRAEALSEQGRLGCLAINSTTELGAGSGPIADMMQRFRAMMREHVARPIVRAAELGEIDADRVDVYADAALSFMVAAAVMSRGGASAAEIDRHIDSARQLVETWRIGRATGS